jgi:hypothetical protein
MQNSSFYTKGWFIGLCLIALACLFMPTDLLAAKTGAEETVAAAGQVAEAADVAEKSKAFGTAPG